MIFIPIDNTDEEYVTLSLVYVLTAKRFRPTNRSVQHMWCKQMMASYLLEACPTDFSTTLYKKNGVYEIIQLQKNVRNY